MSAIVRRALALLVVLPLLLLGACGGNSGPAKEIRWYDAGHELGERSKNDRLAWLGRELALE